MPRKVVYGEEPGMVGWCAMHHTFLKKNGAGDALTHAGQRLTVNNTVE
ncbi:MAG: hypothetical protein ACOX47_04280 [Bacillota bacterium]|jgi:hypothetical protein